MGDRCGVKRKRSSSEVSKTVKGIFKRDDLNLDYSLSTSDRGLSIEDGSKTKKRRNFVRMVHEKLKLACQWLCCFQEFTSYEYFQTHLKEHFLAEDVKSDDVFNCYWTDCTFNTTSPLLLNDHICYHGYHLKLVSLGKNVEARNSNLPTCTQDRFIFPQSLGYICEWENCFYKSHTIYDFFCHVQHHVFHGPKGGKEGPIKCLWKGCTNAPFLWQYKLREHMRKHTNERIVACSTCGHLFGTKTKLADHLKRQLPPELQSYLCSQCSKYFPTERLLRDHMRLHINNYKCSMCEMTCPKPSILAKHIRYRHLTERPYKCEHCSYTCVAKSNLDLHLKRHDPDSLYKCTDCDFKCRSSFGLERHVNVTHGKGRKNVYECHNCAKQFTRGGLLTIHLRRAHNCNWPSGHCRFRYKEMDNGSFQLQDVRYETLGVTAEMIQGKTMCAPSAKEDLKFDLLKTQPEKNSLDRFDVVLCSGADKQAKNKSRKSVVITIDDVDSQGNVVKSQTIESSEIDCSSIDYVPVLLADDVVKPNNSPPRAKKKK